MLLAGSWPLLLVGLIVTLVCGLVLAVLCCPCTAVVAIGSAGNQDCTMLLSYVMGLGAVPVSLVIGLLAMLWATASFVVFSPFTLIYALIYAPSGLLCAGSEGFEADSETSHPARA